MAAFHTPEDGPVEKWHLAGAKKAFEEVKDVENAYHRLFQSANSRLQKFFCSIACRIQNEQTRNWAVDVMYDEAIKMDLSFDGTSSIASILEKGWKSARRFHSYNTPRHDPNLPPLECPVQWAENFTNVENFLKALDILRENNQYIMNLLMALMNVPPYIQYSYEIWEETYEHVKYTLHHHFSHGLVFPGSTIQG